MLLRVFVLYIVCMCACFQCASVVSYDFVPHTHTHTLSLLLTTFCLEHRPTVVACVCIHLAATWKGEDFTNLSSQKSNWWEYVDSSVTLEQLNGKKLCIGVIVCHCIFSSHIISCFICILSLLELTEEFLKIYERCPSRLQKKITEPMKSQVRVRGLKIERELQL